jgi:hypothetical protein
MNDEKQNGIFEKVQAAREVLGLFRDRKDWWGAAAQLPSGERGNADRKRGHDLRCR